MTEAPKFGRYRVTRTIGAGAMGQVFEAVDDVLGREVAIKTLRTASGITARMADERFRLEARAIAQLAHPGVVQVFDIDLAAEPPYIVLERIAGPSLGARLEGGAALDPPDVAALGIQIARALAAAHAAGVLHRDVKPSNILATGTGTWKLADFGVAHVPDSELTMTGQFVGSPAYAPPEALIKGTSGAAGDVYGLGATLYQAATGRWPRLEAKGAILAPVPPVAELAPHLPAHVAAAIDRAIALEHERRPAAAELADLIAGLGAFVAAENGATAGIANAGASPRAASAPGVATDVAAPRATSAPGTDVASPAVAARVSTDPAAFAHTAVAPTLASTTPTPHHRLPWKPLAVVFALLVVFAILLSLRGGSSDTATPAAPLSPTADEPALQPGELKVVPPEGLEANSHAARDWDKVVDQLYKRHYGEARKKLEEWEDHWGPTPETSDLRRQLEAFPDDEERGRGRKHR